MEVDGKFPELATGRKKHKVTGLTLERFDLSLFH